MASTVRAFQSTLLAGWRVDQLPRGEGWEEKGAVTSARVILDVHVKALTRGNVAGLYIRVELTGSAALGTGGNAVPQSAAHPLALCTCLVPHKDGPLPPRPRPPAVGPASLPHPSAEMA